MASSTKPHTPRRSRGSHTTGRPRVDRRLDPKGRQHVAAIVALGGIGWRVTEIRPDISAPVLWHVTIERHDESASISVTEADPDVALEELARYAAADAEEAR